MTTQQTDIEKTLKRILARELSEWPEEVDFLHQWADGEVTGTNFSCGYKTLAIDRNKVDVTRAQWEVERARILEKSSRFTEEDKANIERARIAANQQATQEVRAISKEFRFSGDEDQELWDKVAIQTHEALFHTQDGKAMGFDERAEFSFNEADAFMDERAKRIAARKANHD